MLNVKRWAVLLIALLSLQVMAGPIAEVEYFYSQDGTLIGRAVNGKRLNYEYDLKGQLLAVKDTSGKVIEQYVYDPAGNILSKTIESKKTVYTYDEANQLVSSTYEGKTTTYEYDAAGRLVREGSKTYSYGYLDKILEVQENGKQVAAFDYHVDGQVASATYSDKSECFVWDGLALIRRNENTFINEPHVTGGNPILSSKDGVMFNDMLGNTLNIGGKHVGMTAFGETTDKEAMFTGKPYIGELGYAFLFRNYRADNGKWQTADPLGYPDGWNNLAYIDNQPSCAIDLFGAWKLQYVTGETSQTETISSGITPLVLPSSITNYKMLVSFETNVSSYELVSSLTVTSTISLTMMSQTTIFSTNPLIEPDVGDWVEDKDYACSLAFSTTYSIDEKGGIVTSGDGTNRNLITATKGGILDDTSVALSQVVPNVFPSADGQIFNHQVGGRGAYSASNILNAISVGWGAVGIGFNFENVSLQTKLFQSIVNIKKVNE